MLPPGGITDASGRFSLWFEGVLHEPAELASRLGTFAPGTTDAALVLQGLRHFGPDVVRHLYGDFAWVAWDAHDRALIGATEPFGLRPLFYRVLSGGIAFARRATQLDRGGSDLDRGCLVGSLAHVDVDAERTFYRDIKRLPGGHVLRASRTGVRVQRYWTPERTESGVRSAPDLVERFRTLFLESVRNRIKSVGSPVIMLSGGFDSNSLAAAVGHLARRGEADAARSSAWSQCFPGLDCDETRRIDVAIPRLPFPAFRKSFAPAGLTTEQLLETAEEHDLPLLPTQRALFQALFSHLRDRGVSTVASGIGGDELAVDYDYQVDLLRERGLLAGLSAFAEVEGRTRAGAFRWLVRDAVDPLFAASRRERRWRWLRSEARALLADEAGGAPPIEEATQSHTSNVRLFVIRAAAVQRACEWWSSTFANRGLSLWSPFHDRKLFELVLSAPGSSVPRSYHAGTFKPLLVAALRDLVPGELTARYWKVTLEAYEMGVLEQSLGSIAEVLHDTAPWESAELASRAGGTRMLTILRNDNVPAAERARILRSLGALMGLEAWFRARKKLRGADHGRQR